MTNPQQASSSTRKLDSYTWKKREEDVAAMPRAPWSGVESAPCGGTVVSWTPGSCQFPKIRTFANTIHENELKMDERPKYKTDTIEVLEENIGRTLFYINHSNIFWDALPCDSAGKESACNEGDLGSILGLGRSPGRGKGYPFQYSSLEKSMDCIVHGVSRSLTPLNDFPFHSKYKMVSSKFKVAVHSVIIYPICNRIYSKENSLWFVCV